GGGARRELRRLGGIEDRQRRREAVPDLAGLRVAPLGRELGVRARPLGEALFPLFLLFGASRTPIAMPTDGRRDVEAQLGVPAERALGRRDLADAERLAVRLRAAALAGRVMRDHGAQADQRRPLLLRDPGADGGLDRLDVLAVVDLERLPSLRRE